MNKKIVRGANPYMPLWEHVPDGEPRVFTYNGETRIYLFGSHDTKKTDYCGPDYVSAIRHQTAVTSMLLT